MRGAYKYVLFTSLRGATRDGSELISLHYAYNDRYGALNGLNYYVQDAIDRGYELVNGVGSTVTLEREGEILKVCVQEVRCE